jgi:hypothetical protein
VSVSARVGQTASADANQARTLLGQTAGLWTLVGASNSQIAPALAAFNCPPDLTGRHCALFLTLRTLRI